MPENVSDRYTMGSEPVIFFNKSRKYYFNKEKGRRAIWSINTKGQNDPHYAAFPEDLCNLSAPTSQKPF